MKSNIGNRDATVRVLLGIVVAGLGIYYNSWWGFAAVIPFVTAFTGFCPLYQVTGINTRKPKRTGIRIH